MPLPEGYTPRTGDVLLIPVTVYSEHDPDESTIYVALSPDGHHDRVFVDRDRVHSFVSRKWQPEERCRLKRTRVLGTIIASSGDKVWVRLDPVVRANLPGEDIVRESWMLEEVPVDPIDKDFTDLIPATPMEDRRFAVPLGGAKLSEPFCEPPPPGFKPTSAADEDGGDDPIF